MANGTIKYLSFADRLKIAKMYQKNMSVVKIAEAIGVVPRTLYAELERGFTGEIDSNGRYGYDPEKAQALYTARLRTRGRPRERLERLYRQMQEQEAAKNESI